MDVGSDRGQVDNENNSQSRYRTYRYRQGGSIYTGREHSIRNRSITEYRSEHRKAVCTEGKHRNGMPEMGQDRNKNKNRNWNWTKLEEKMRAALGFPSSSMELKFRESQESV